MLILFVKKQWFSLTQKGQKLRGLRPTSLGLSCPPPGCKTEDNNIVFAFFYMREGPKRRSQCYGNIARQENNVIPQWSIAHRQDCILFQKNSDHKHNRKIYNLAKLAFLSKKISSIQIQFVVSKLKNNLKIYNFLWNNRGKFKWSPLCNM